MKVVHQFALDSKIGTSTTTKNGKLATQTDYYRLDFKADAEGNVAYVE